MKLDFKKYRECVENGHQSSGFTFMTPISIEVCKHCGIEYQTKNDQGEDELIEDPCGYVGIQEIGRIPDQSPQIVEAGNN